MRTHTHKHVSRVRNWGRVTPSWVTRIFRLLLGGVGCGRALHTNTRGGVTAAYALVYLDPNGAGWLLKRLIKHSRSS